MNAIDIVICVFFGLSLIFGLKDGVIRQLTTLIGVIVAIILAKSFGDTVATMLNIGGEYSSILGYVIVLILSLIVVGLVSYLLRKLVKFVGLGFVDRLFGAILSLVTCALFMAIVFSVFDTFNRATHMVEQETISESRLYKPVLSLSKYIVPAIEWIGEKIPEGVDKVGDKIEEIEI